MPNEDFFTIAAITISIIVYISCFSPVGALNKAEENFNQYQINQSQEINSRYHIDQEPSVLYLDQGMAPFFFRANSSCRYIAPLVLIRNTENWSIAHLPQYQEEYNCVMEYQGKYIVMQGKELNYDWVGELQPSRQPIMDMIHRNYTLVFNGTWRVWERMT